MEQRFAFDEIANIYKTARPDYPEALIEDVVAYADLKPNDDILEVGCGTGQATKSFAKRNFSVLAIDPGPEMLRGARESLAGFNNVRFLEIPFEAWPAKQGEFRLIVAAQSWHWVSPEMRFVRAAEALSPEGSLAVFGHVPVGLPDPLLAQSRKFTCVTPVSGVARRRHGTSPTVRSKAGLISRSCSGQSPTRAIRGSGGTRHQAASRSCARNRSTGC
jgi:SAM-dependent methyltransferase